MARCDKISTIRTPAVHNTSPPNTLWYGALRLTSVSRLPPLYLHRLKWSYHSSGHWNKWLSTLTRIHLTTVIPGTTISVEISNKYWGGRVVPRPDPGAHYGQGKSVPPISWRLVSRTCLLVPTRAPGSMTSLSVYLVLQWTTKCWSPARVKAMNPVLLHDPVVSWSRDMPLIMVIISRILTFTL